MDEAVNNNLLYIREMANIPKKVISDLINVSVYTYTGYEQGRMFIPEETKIIIKNIYDISLNELCCSINDISETTRNKLMQLAHLTNQEKKEKLIYNLTKRRSENLTYRQINKIKATIRNNINLNTVK
ncbi:MAG: helix-turn-helix transcriptional regulator [Clostridia bacterium]|nr:helix-turn-helix transcriptional regulator [Clostridia bacterium]